MIWSTCACRNDGSKVRIVRHLVIKLSNKLILEWKPQESGDAGATCPGDEEEDEEDNEDDKDRGEEPGKG